MPTYISEKNGEMDTGDMSQPYLERALAKAEREGNEENIKALSEEIKLRGGEEPTDDTEEVEPDTNDPSQFPADGNDIVDYQ